MNPDGGESLDINNNVNNFKENEKKYLLLYIFNNYFS